MALTDEERELIRQRLIVNVAEIRRKMEGVTEEEILEALRDDDNELPKNGRGAKRRASASTRTPSPRG
jgi:hypothetical protein